MSLSSRERSLRVFARTIECAVVALTVVNCSQQQPGIPQNIPLRSYWREVYHTSPLTYRPAFNLGPAREVWRSNPVLAYDTFFVGSEYRGERDSCGIDPVAITAAAISPPEYVLVQDSGWIVDEVLPGQVNPRPHADGLRLFQAFYIPADSVVPVFVIPRLIQLQANGTYAWRGVYGFAYPGGALYPAIWLNSRQIEDHVITQPINRRPYSVLAHEMAHILVDPLNFPGDSTWTDNSTPFLHIETHIGFTRKTRVSAVGPGPVQSVVADDMNRKTLMAFGIEDACILARTHFPFVLPVLP